MLCVKLPLNMPVPVVTFLVTTFSLETNLETTPMETWRSGYQKWLLVLVTRSRHPSPPSRSGGYPHGYLAFGYRRDPDAAYSGFANSSHHLQANANGSQTIITSRLKGSAAPAVCNSHNPGVFQGTFLYFGRSAGSHVKDGKTLRTRVRTLAET